MNDLFTIACDAIGPAPVGAIIGSILGTIISYSIFFLPWSTK